MTSKLSASKTAPPVGSSDLVSGSDFHQLQRMIFGFERKLDCTSAAAKQLGEAREVIGLARKAFEFDAANSQLTNGPAVSSNERSM